MIRTALLAVFALSCAWANTASADIITDIQLSDLEGDGTFLTDTGIVGDFTDSGFGASRDFTYEVTGLDLAGDGTANDTILFGLNFTAASSVAGAGVALTSAGQSEAAFGVGPDSANDGGNSDINEIGDNDGATESLTLTTVDPIVTLGDGQILDSFTFNGFGGNVETFFVSAGAGGDANNTLVGATVGGVAALPGSGNGSVIQFDDPTSDTIVFNSDPSATTNTGFYVGNFSANYTFDVAAVPEPSSVALLGLGSVLLIGRRRRS